MSIIDTIFGNETVSKQVYNKRGEILHEWQDAYNQLKPAHDTLTVENRSLKVKVTELQFKITEGNKKQQLLSSSQQQLEKEKAELAATIEPLREKLTTLEVEYQKQQAAIKTLSENLEEANTKLEKTKQEALAILKTTQWTKLLETDTEIGYRGYLQGSGLSLVKIRKAQVKTLPVKTEGGYDVFEDGSKYPCDLMDLVYTGEQSKIENYNQIPETNSPAPEKIHQTNTILMENEATPDSQAKDEIKESYLSTSITGIEREVVCDEKL